MHGEPESNLWVVIILMIILKAGEKKGKSF